MVGVLLPMWWGRIWEGQGWGAYKPSVPPMDDAKTTPSTTQQMMIMIFFCRQEGREGGRRQRDREVKRHTNRQTDGEEGVRKKKRGEKTEKGRGQNQR